VFEDQQNVLLVLERYVGPEGVCPRPHGAVAETCSVDQPRDAGVLEALIRNQTRPNLVIYSHTGTPGSPAGAVGARTASRPSGRRG